jgi:dUTP pyrophosphatase
MVEEITVKFKRLSEEFNNILLPSYSTSGSAGMDIRVAIKEPMKLKPMEVEMIATNLSVEIPEGFEIQVRPRSGLAAKHGIGILNSPGTIDSDYRGEVKIILINFSKDDFIIQPGDRIAQIILSKVYRAKLEETKELNKSKRGDGGFGHSGNS